jgi:hypothetical protein
MTSGAWHAWHRPGELGSVSGGCAAAATNVGGASENPAPGDMRRTTAAAFSFMRRCEVVDAATSDVVGIDADTMGVQGRFRTPTPEARAATMNDVGDERPVRKASSADRRGVPSEVSRSDGSPASCGFRHGLVAQGRGRRTVLGVTFANARPDHFASTELADLIASLSTDSRSEVGHVSFVRVGVDTDMQNGSGKSDLSVIVGIDTELVGEIDGDGAGLDGLEPDSGSCRAGVDHVGGSEPEEPGSLQHGAGGPAR